MRSADPNSTGSGVYLSGGWLYNALDGNNLDAYENEGQGMDMCISHSTPFG